MICISHPQRLDIKNWLAPGSSEETSGKVLSWESSEMEGPTITACTISFNGLQSFNSIHINLNEQHPSSFPANFRFEISSDGYIWEPLLYETDYRIGPSTKARWNFALSSATHLKFVFLTDKKTKNGKYFIAFGEVYVLISGTSKIQASSELDRLWVKENIIDQRVEYGWSTAPRSQPTKEHIQLDLGSVNCLSEVRILSKDDIDTFFPTQFQLFYSQDQITWHLLFEENIFLAEPACWYRWRFLPIYAQYIRLVILEGSRTHEGKYISQLIELEIYAIADILQVAQNLSLSDFPPASILRHGLVRLAANGENKEGVVIQSNDKRLRKATTEYEGIVELALDGEEQERLAVQANDRRLKYSTENHSGIVRLARKEEKRAGHVLQSNDPRLNLATTESSGLVELASDGETRSGVAVQGNDKRLYRATSSSPGIVRLAEDKSDQPNEVVQGNDSRLHKGNIESFGIVRLARHQENKPERVVQSNDPRIQPASTEKKGIVELANDRESQKGKVVQSHDSRLQEATESSAGITKLASLGYSVQGATVQSNDPRLHDKREPKPHEHHYAPINHSHNNHIGNLKIESKEGKSFKGFHPPSFGYSPIMGMNHGDGAGVVGRAQKEGVLGVGDDSGVIGLGTGEGRGVLGLSQRNAGGFFASENSYSLIAGGEIKQREIMSSKLALLANGISNFTDTIYSQVSSACIACYFSVKPGENISPCHVVSIGENGDIFRPHEYGSSRVIGIAVSQAAIILNTPNNVLPKGEETVKGPFALSPQRDKILVAIAGIVDVDVVVSRQGIQAGDLLVTSMIEAGAAQSLEERHYSPGIVFARSLETLVQGQKKVKSILAIS